ncbi:annexin A13 [Nilaparvata lugens]|uniref:annexin A13 n=1 Tax=Nilaparvata lugens TaxID=108931 RepID=UPI00193DBA12|nr:annexin A13 [Nilaparvata lugens]
MSTLEIVASFYIFMIAVCGIATADPAAPPPPAPDATIIFKANDANADAQALRKAMKGWGTDENQIIQILGARTGQQRAAITAAYKTTLQRDLVKDIEGDTSGTFEDVLVYLTYSVEEYLAREINWALNKKDTYDYIDIICACEPNQIKSIKEAYLRVFKISLPSDIEAHVNYIPTRMLLFLILGAGIDLPYRQDYEFKDKTIKSYVKSIPDNEDDCSSEKNGVFFTLMYKESMRLIQTVVKQYNGDKSKDKSVTSKIEKYCKEPSLKRAYMTIASYAEDSATYFATQLKNSMKGLGTTERTLDRVIIWRSEIDLVKVATAFQVLTKHSLEDWVKGDTAGDYEKILVALIRGNRA